MHGKAVKLLAALVARLFTLGLVACHAMPLQAGSRPDTPTIFRKLMIKGEDHKSGIFDISLEYDNTGVGWMAYSRVELPKYVETHIASSHDHGKSWNYVTTVNHSHEGVFNDEGKQLKGVWRNETPTLLYDPTDTAPQRWKLFSHHYPARPPYKKGSHLYARGWIEYQAAADPAGPWSEPVRLFGKREDHCRVDLSKLHPGLGNILWYNEMGSVVVDGVIYLTLDASATPSGLGKWRQRKIILIASDDHGRSWRYVGTLTDYADADKFGYLIFTGSSLVKVGKQLFLLISPSGAKGLFRKNRAHDGTMVVEVEDITRATLSRDAAGKLVVLDWIKPSLQSGGVSDYDEQNTGGGILFSQINTAAKGRNADFFQVYSTGKWVVQP